MTTRAPPWPSSQRRDRKRRLLLDHTATVAFGLFEAHGFEAVTMEQVAAVADIAKGTLYKYFPVKEALLAHHFQQQIDSDMDLLWPRLERHHSFAAQLRELLRTCAQWHEARRIYIPHYVRYQFTAADLDDGAAARPHRPRGARQILEYLCSAGQHRGDVRKDLSASQLAVLLGCLCLGAITIWLGRPDASLQHEFDALLALALRGVSP